MGITLPESPVDGGDLRAVIEGLGELALSNSPWEETALGEAGQVVAMGRNARISHVGVHIGGGFVLHCSQAPGMVIVQTISQLQRQWATLKIYNYTG